MRTENKLINILKRYVTTQTFLIFFGFATLVLLVAIVWQAQYVRPFQDDFNVAALRNFQPSEWLPVLLGTNGRVSALLATAFVSMTGLWWISGLVSVLLLIVGMYLLIAELLKVIHKESIKRIRIIAAIAAIVITVSTTLMLSNPFSNLYWTSAAIVHTWSWGFALIIISYLIRIFKEKKFSIARAFVLILVAIPFLLFGELASVAVLTSSLLCLVYGVISKNSVGVRYAVSTLTAGIIALIILRFSPGALSRVSDEGAGLGLLGSIEQLPQYVYSYWSSGLANKSILLVIFLLGVSCGLLGFKYKKKLSRTVAIKRWAGIMATITAAVLVVWTASIFIVLYSIPWSTTAFFPERTQTFTAVSLITFFLMIGYGAGRLLIDLNMSKWVVSFTKVGSVLGIVLLVVLHTGYLSKVMQIHERIYDRYEVFMVREGELLSAKTNNKDFSCPIKIPSTTVEGIQEGPDLTGDKFFWINKGMASYYQVDKCGLQAD